MIRKARIEDVKQIHELINFYAGKGEMLPRSLNAIYEFIRDFYVFVKGKKVVGCCALHISWHDLGEIRSLAVSQRHLSKGIGAALMKTCIKEAGHLGLIRIFALTYKPEYFKKFGFRKAKKEKLPHKIWGECIHCPKFPDCDETALILELVR